MGDFSDNYTRNKKGYIFFGLGNKTVKFKPFIDSFSFSFTSKFTESEENVYNKEFKVKDYEKAEFSIKFNVLATNVNESIENHKKYQKLLRMMMPMVGANLDVPKKMEALFSNLISSTNGSGTNYFSNNRSFNCIISDLNYSPIMELGFFEYNGLLFSKGFSLDIKMSATAKISSEIENVPYFKSGFGYGRTFNPQRQQEQEQPESEEVSVEEGEEGGGEDSSGGDSLVERVSNIGSRFLDLLNQGTTETTETEQDKKKIKEAQKQADGVEATPDVGDRRIRSEEDAE